MPTKLSRFCLGVMEAAWLAAVSIIPIFFNIYSSRIFEPDKITILRSLALITLAAGVVKLVDEGGIKWKSDRQNQSLFRYILSYPMVIPVIGLIIVYSISTIFSVTPSISLLGSYQRLQGTYTTFSYLIIFFSVVVNLRKSEQIHRLVTTVIFTSLPIALYGLLQHYAIDPIPWGGNVSVRIASNMGNSIFVAAYMIMVFPLTIGRIIESFKAILVEPNASEAGNQTSKNILRATIYVIIAVMQLIAIYFSGSRGPLLGLLAGSFILVLLLSIYWRKRWLSIVVIGLAVAGVAFLAVFNMSSGPLETLKKSPAVGRFGNLLNPESNSALVRQYIWEGTVKLVGLHAPLVFPDGSTDKYNFLRPIIGYGPESMYVAYNQFYQPELGQVEKRNASPDRSHNETWDSIVITGISGLLVYLLIFGGVFYYALKWLGLLNSRRNLFLFLICLIGGGIIGTIALIILKGVEYLGIGLPFGMVIGLVIYLCYYALFSTFENKENHRINSYSLLIIVLFAAIVGHFIEINFGIAIVSTRTLFWVFAGVIIVTGFVLPKIVTSEPQLPLVENIGEGKIVSAGRKKDRSSTRSNRKSENSKRPFLGDRPDWYRNGLIGAMIIGIIMVTLGYDFITNSDRTTSVITIIVNSLTQLGNKNNAVSFGVLILLFLPTWLMGTLLYAAELRGSQDDSAWMKNLSLMAVVSLAIGFLFWLLHSISLAALVSFIPKDQNDVITQVNSIGALLTKYYLYILLVMIVLAFILPDEWPSRSFSSSKLGIVTAPIALVLALALIYPSNLKVVQADITFKMAEPFTKGGQWQVATFLYQRALQLAPKEDHYYLFLGRSYLETAKTTEAAADQDKLVLQAEEDLKVAQSINPLNTDHTANLARLYTWWAGKAAPNTDTRTERAQKASDYYSTAVKLSPNNSTLWDEWAVLSMQIMGQPEHAYQMLQHALSLDTKYNYTQGLLGDYYMRIASASTDTDAKLQALQTAEQYYQTAITVTKYTDVNPKTTYLLSLSNVYVQQASLNPDQIDQTQLRKAVDVLQQAITAGLTPNDLWRVQETLANLYLQLGDKSNAQFYANAALQGAPTSATSRIQDLITQTLSLP